MDFVEDKDVSDLDVFETRNCDKVAFRDDVGATSDGGDGVVVWLRFEEGEGRLVGAD